MWSGFLLLVRNTGCEVAVSPGCMLLMTHSLPCRVSASFPSRPQCQSSPILQQSSGLCYCWSSTSFTLQKMPCFLFLDLISKSFPMLLPAQCSSTLVVSFQILCKFRTFWKTLQCERRLIKNTGPKQKYFSVFQMLRMSTTCKWES